ncbi:MAG: acyltransferase family protein [Chitinivibrionales bacterium]|nr:acyltransferase family protein [Chitinivibrionales bacterium]
MTTKINVSLPGSGKANPDSTSGPPTLDWLNPLKAFALLAILLNHFVEEFGSGPWFTNPSQDWPDFSTRIGNVFPTEHPFPISLVQFLGWLGDSGPGVFILASGFGLMWSAVHKPLLADSPRQFYQRRLVRIFPLYIAAHFFILFLALFVPGSDLTLSSPKTFLSLLGLRFTDGLFFYINPSWWFVWLILQLYLLFPFLYRFQKRIGPRNFLIFTLVVTFASRIAGMAGMRYSDSLYYWMTGIFFGTRLAEFAVGMVLAVYLHRILNSGGRLPPVSRIAGVSVFAYVLGLLASFTWPGTIVSNLLVTAGMSGLFYAVWQGILKRNRVLAIAITWIGIESYAIYLVHQTPLKWTTNFYGGNDAMHLVFATIVLVLSFPVGAMLSRAVDKFTGLAPGLLSGKIAIGLTWVLGLFAVPLLLLIETKLQNPYLHRHLSLFLGIILMVLLYLERGSPLGEKALGRLIRWASLTGLLAALFVLPANYGYVALAAAGVFSVIAVMLYHYFGMRRILAWITSGTVCIIFAIVLELSLSYLAPIEAGRWGELPALEVHPTRVYGLKPDISVRLKYNNYNYVLKTNSLGFASPEIPVERPTPETFRVLIIGDAFSMPEGMAYQCAYPPLLEQKLKYCLGDRPVQVINAGVTGYGPVEQLPQLKELLPLYNPDIVINEFFINEFI